MKRLALGGNVARISDFARRAFARFCRRGLGAGARGRAARRSRLRVPRLAGRRADVDLLRLVPRQHCERPDHGAPGLSGGPAQPDRHRPAGRDPRRGRAAEAVPAGGLPAGDARRGAAQPRDPHRDRPAQRLAIALLCRADRRRRHPPAGFRQRRALEDPVPLPQVRRRRRAASAISRPGPRPTSAASRRATRASSTPPSGRSGAPFATTSRVSRPRRAPSRAAADRSSRGKRP